MKMGEIFMPLLKDVFFKKAFFLTSKSVASSIFLYQKHYQLRELD